MAHITKPRVGETSTTTGTGAFTLAGALMAHQAFSAVCSVGDTVFYDIAAVDGTGAETGVWEEGLGTYSGVNTLTRTTVLHSSTGSAVNFGAGTKFVRLIAEASQLTSLAMANTFTKAQRGAFVVLTDAATIALDLSLANQFRVQLGGNRTLGVPTNIVAGQQGVINVRQDATGSRTMAYAWPYEWFGGTAGVLSTPGCSRDMLGYSVDQYNSAAVTITIATPGVVSFTGHGFLSGQRVQITTTGALPTGLTASTTYFVSVVDADSFKLCTSLANAAAGTFIATSGTQSGVHTLTGCSITLNLSKAAA